MQPKLENYMIHIVDVHVRKPGEHCAGPYEVVFRLDKSPDDHWVELFNNLTHHTPSIHKPVVDSRNQEITWQADEENIKKDKHWIYDYVDDANRRFPPILQNRIAQREEERQRDKAKDAKIAELNRMLQDDLHSKE